ncbi:Glu/Leu/Phe/Val dehydrogenase dimerization domain-containing protein [Paraglaciecola sp.]|uniref:Glu/Leu/Phe/Val dehydrogenase dimerization domain-containing protein n=1 Tax=Paraglaciecola sp. TaxID=1920173 RepID=UPI00326353AC
MSIFEHSEFDNHEHVAFCRDKRSGLSAIIAIHDTGLGVSLGGCRMWPYKTSEDALHDVLRLSKGMTYKAAMAGLKQGGGKAVIIGDPSTEKTPEMMAAMGKFIDSLSGNYISAEDSGMTVADLKLIEKTTPYVAGIHAKYHIDNNSTDGNPAPSTAYGVFVGLKASVDYALGQALKDTKILIEGLGQVGMRLAAYLHKSGAKLYVTDINQVNIDKAVEAYDAVAVPIEEAYSLNVDVYAPCALGATLNENTINELKVKVVAGAANNQLENEEFGEILRTKGILYAPDYVINAGGVIDIYHQSIVSSKQKLKEHIEAIEQTLIEIYRRSAAESKAPNLIANKIAEERFGK